MHATQHPTAQDLVLAPALTTHRLPVLAMVQPGYPGDTGPPGGGGGGGGGRGGGGGGGTQGL